MTGITVYPVARGTNKPPVYDAAGAKHMQERDSARKLAIGRAFLLLVASCSRRQHAR